MITFFKRHQKNILCFFLVFMILVLVFLNIRIISRRRLVNKEIDILKQRMQDLQDKREEFSEQLKQAGTQEYLERIGREDLNLKKQGESVVAFPMQELKQEETKEKDSFWNRLLKSMGLRD